MAAQQFYWKHDVIVIAAIRAREWSWETCANAKECNSGARAESRKMNEHVVNCIFLCFRCKCGIAVMVNTELVGKGGGGGAGNVMDWGPIICLKMSIDL